MTSDAERWDRRYADAHPPEKLEPPAIVVEAVTYVTAPDGRAGDIACGWGDAGLWLAQHGLSATCFDVSAVALAAVATRASKLGLHVKTDLHDTTTDGVPAGPWDLLSCTHYLDRDMLRGVANELSVGGIVAVAIATKTNLDRHERPSERFLLDPGELHALITEAKPGLEILRSDEAWRDNGVHEAWLIAKRT